MFYGYRNSEEVKMIILKVVVEANMSMTKGRLVDINDQKENVKTDIDNSKQTEILIAKGKRKFSIDGERENLVLMGFKQR